MKGLNRCSHLAGLFVSSKYLNRCCSRSTNLPFMPVDLALMLICELGESVELRNHKLRIVGRLVEFEVENPGEPSTANQAVSVFVPHLF